MNRHAPEFRSTSIGLFPPSAAPSSPSSRKATVLYETTSLSPSTNDDSLTSLTRDSGQALLRRARKSEAQSRARSRSIILVRSHVEVVPPASQVTSCRANLTVKKDDLAIIVDHIEVVTHPRVRPCPGNSSSSVSSLKHIVHNAGQTSLLYPCSTASQFGHLVAGQRHICRIDGLRYSAAHDFVDCAGY